MPPPLRRSPPLKLSYGWGDEKWEATLAGEKITSSLDTDRAKFLLKTLENLKVSRWLSPGDEAATIALKTPFITFDITQRTVDDLGDEGADKHETLTLAHDPNTKFIYGKISSDPSPFAIAPEDFLKLSIPLLDQ